MFNRDCGDMDNKVKVIGGGAIKDCGRGWYEVRVESKYDMV